MLLLSKLNLDSKLSKDNQIQLLMAQAIKTSHQVFINRYNNNELKNYTYNPSIASEELGIDVELVGELINDYISQIFKTRYQFDNIICHIRELKDVDKIAKYLELKNLAHKNLGVAKNLRIEDAEIFLDDLMKKDDVDHLEDSVNALEACAFKLNPKHAFNVLQLMKLKSSL